MPLLLSSYSLLSTCTSFTTRLCAFGFLTYRQCPACHAFPPLLPCMATFLPLPTPDISTYLPWHSVIPAAMSLWLGVEGQAFFCLSHLPLPPSVPSNSISACTFL